MSSGLGTRDRNARQSTRCASGAFLTCYTQLSDRQKRLRNRQKSQYLARAHDRRSASCKLQGECDSKHAEPRATVQPVNALLQARHGSRNFSVFAAALVLSGSLLVGCHRGPATVMAELDEARRLAADARVEFTKFDLAAEQWLHQ